MRPLRGTTSNILELTISCNPIPLILSTPVQWSQRCFFLIYHVFLEGITDDGEMGSGWEAWCPSASWPSHVIVAVWRWGTSNSAGAGWSSSIIIDHHRTSSFSHWSDVISQVLEPHPPISGQPNNKDSLESVARRLHGTTPFHRWQPAAKSFAKIIFIYIYTLCTYIIWYIYIYVYNI